MYNEQLVEQAKMVAKLAHAGQMRVDGSDYFENHVCKVADACSDNATKIVAYLHDTIEDTDVTEEFLLKFFPQKIVEAVVAITNKPDEQYPRYIAKVASNSWATYVKIRDLEHNLSTWPSHWSAHKKHKYELALMYLDLYTLHEPT